MTLRAALDAVLAKFYLLYTSAHARYLRNTKTGTYRANAWWTPELGCERGRVRAMRRKYQRARDPDMRAQLRDVLKYSTPAASERRATSAEQAEEAAIALALSGIPEATTILSDSRTAIANFGRGSVGTPVASLLPRTKSTTTHLRWFPAHVGVIPGGAANRNEEADVVARELAYRAAPPRPSEADEADFLDPDPLLDYGGILAWYREGRRALPGPHPRLGRREGVLLRQLQTGTVLTPALARHVCPGLFESATCSVCARELATLAHVLWGCDACAGEPCGTLCHRTWNTTSVRLTIRRNSKPSSGSTRPWPGKSERRQLLVASAGPVRAEV
ncbi:hypothetical protein HPB49_012596 [Dermacentor silvarum]|uniref:Uncharacterized protein n=1 Tax=Dermacentor silvarum TaxID=543639 RepID=A0ACB8C3P5_DERSI|nr:hypothetical protein HPB49_012596 [Dermacentor silvarum]